MKTILLLKNATREEKTIKVKELIKGFKMININTIGDMETGLTILRSYKKDNIILNSITHCLSGGKYNVEIKKLYINIRIK